jgi:hypothetical protein
MSNISKFFKHNKPVRENVFYAATKSLRDENGEPLMWEIKPISTRENDVIQEMCMTEVPIKGKPNQYRQKINAISYIGKLLAASVVDPDLCNAELLDNYGVNKPEELIREIIDDVGEYNAFTTFVQQFNNFVPLQDDIDESKN